MVIGEGQTAAGYANGDPRRAGPQGVRWKKDSEVLISRNSARCGMGTGIRSQAAVAAYPGLDVFQLFRSGFTFNESFCYWHSLTLQKKA